MSFLDDDIITKQNMVSIEENISIVDEYVETKIPNEEQRMMAIEYIQQLEFYDKMALTLSIEILGSSFDLIKSNGFKEWHTLRVKKNM